MAERACPSDRQEKQTVTQIMARQPASKMAFSHLRLSFCCGRLPSVFKLGLPFESLNSTGWGGGGCHGRDDQLKSSHPETGFQKPGPCPPRPCLLPRPAPPWWGAEEGDRSPPPGGAFEEAPEGPSLSPFSVTACDRLVGETRQLLPNLGLGAQGTVLFPPAVRCSRSCGPGNGRRPGREGRKRERPRHGWDHDKRRPPPPESVASATQCDLRS